MNRATCSVTRWTTSSALLPTEVTAIPEPKSISELPSASMHHAAAGGGHEHRQDMAEPPGDAALPPLEQLPRDGSGDLGDEAALLGERGAAGGSIHAHTRDNRPPGQ